MTNTFKLGGDIEVARMGFGAMQITGPQVWGWPIDRSAIDTLLRRVVELGIQLIDTADAYGPETSEYLLAETLHPYDGLLITTKGGYERSGPGKWTVNCRPDHLRIACINSMRRLGIDCIDLYQLHIIDDDVPLEESLGALKELQFEGKIRHIGVSNFSVAELERARKVVEVVTVQNHYNLANREHEAVIDYCTRHGIGFIPWYPLARGDLNSEKRLAVIAAAYGASAGQVALAWLLKRSPVILPIPGTSSLAHLEENIAARDLLLSDEDFSSLSEILF